ncbi:hypothetical protein BKA56DRAFT_105389 [Ilyonectria sp. MPI-CAGE-AT-0026]|nr:hypothetical protein BKA56DRAFT_105389 [Ilyonectria sp. MPI-CAGE-AT-0026]
MGRKQPQRALPKGSKNQAEHGSRRDKSPQQLLPDNAESDPSPPSPAGKPLDQQGSLAAEKRGTKRSANGQQPRRSPRFAAVENIAVVENNPITVTPAIRASDIKQPIDPIEHWVIEKHWPKAYSQTSKMAHLLARPLFPASETSSTKTSIAPDLRPKEEKIPYKDEIYVDVLAGKGSFLEESDLGMADESMKLVQDLLDGPQQIPNESPFDDDIFEAFCNNLNDRNEIRVRLDISRLIVPSAEAHALRAKHLKYLRETNDELWSVSIPLIGPIPKPDYSVGFRSRAFTSDQLAKLKPFLVTFSTGGQSFFMGTKMTYFPFLACESKRGAGDLSVAERQNAHSMTLAVRGVAELFRWRERESEVDRQILAFSITHDHRSVTIYGHYPVMGGKDIQYYRHTIKYIDIRADNGEKKWAAYRFVKNLYDIWVPAHLKRLSSVIDEIPDDLDFAPEQNDHSQDPEGEESTASPPPPVDLPTEKDA